MGAAARNPLIDRYYSPLAGPTDFDTYESDMAAKRIEVICALEEKRARAEKAGRKDEVAEIEARLRLIKQQ